MKKFVIAIIVTFVVGMGLGYALPHAAKQTGERVLGAAQVQLNSTQFAGGVSAGSTEQFSVDTSGNLTTTGALSSGSQTVTGNVSVSGAITGQSFKTASIGVATTTSGSIGSAAAGYLAIPAGSTSLFATSTLIDLNSQVFLTQFSTTTNASFLSAMGTAVCNTTIATATPIVYIQASSTNAGLNGFKVTLNNAPITNPGCYFYSIRN